MADLQGLLKTVKEMSVVELNDFVKLLETEFGVSAAAVAAAPSAGGAAGGAAAAGGEEQTEFKIILKEVGPNKINVIKVVREITGLGLGEAKALVDGAPGTIKEGVSKAAAQEAEAKFKEAGAVCELK